MSFAASYSTPVLDEPYPCERCAFYELCGSQGLACHAFNLYCNQRDNKRDQAERDWRDGYCLPSPAWLKATFENNHAAARYALQADERAVRAAGGR